jgi:hypothetical protein
LGQDEQGFGEWLQDLEFCLRCTKRMGEEDVDVVDDPNSSCPSFGRDTVHMGSNSTSEEEPTFLTCKRSTLIPTASTYPHLFSYILRTTLTLQRRERHLDPPIQPRRNPLAHQQTHFKSTARWTPTCRRRQGWKVLIRREFQASLKRR